MIGMECYALISVSLISVKTHSILNFLFPPERMVSAPSERITFLPLGRMISNLVIERAKNATKLGVIELRKSGVSHGIPSSQRCKPKG